MTGTDRLVTSQPRVAACDVAGSRLRHRESRHSPCRCPPGGRTPRPALCPADRGNGYQARELLDRLGSHPAGQIRAHLERLPDGEVSAFLHDVVVSRQDRGARDRIGGTSSGCKGRRPDPADRGAQASCRDGDGASSPATDARAATCSTSSRSRRTHLLTELERLRSQDGFAVFHTLTRAQPPGWTGYARRIDTAMLGEVVARSDRLHRLHLRPDAPLEGPRGLVTLGIAPARIRTERFGRRGTERQDHDDDFEQDPSTRCALRQRRRRHPSGLVGAR